MCQRGKIRVDGAHACSCGHSVFVCDFCYKYFTVKCGKPFGESKLSPQFSMAFDSDLTRSVWSVCIRRKGGGKRKN